MSTAIAGKKLSTKRAEWDVRQRARQLKAHPDCRSTTIKLTRHENIACVIVAPRQSSSRRDRRNGHPDCRCVPIQIVAQHGIFVDADLIEPCGACADAKALEHSDEGLDDFLSLFLTF